MQHTTARSNMVDHIISDESPVIHVSKQSQLKTDLYFRAMVIRAKNGKLVLRDGITLRYSVQTRSAPAPIKVIWEGGAEAPVLDRAV